MGFGTWAWGNQLLWGYQESMDTELQQTFNLAVENGIYLFDTADSYGTGKLNGQSEKLLGKFIREFQGQFFLFLVPFTPYLVIKGFKKIGLSSSFQVVIKSINQCFLTKCVSPSGEVCQAVNF
jgi:hypothetical protein